MAANCTDRLRALQMKLKTWGYHTYRTQENKETFRRKRKRSSATPQEQYQSEHRILEEASLSLGPVDFDGAVNGLLALTPGNVPSNGLSPERSPSSTSSTSREEYQISTNKPLLMLHEAVKSNDTTSIDSLLQAGADIYAFDDDGYQALHYAVSEHTRGRDDRAACILATQLLLSGADAVTRTRDLGSSSMHLALWSSKLLEILLRNQVDVNVKDWVGDTPLHKAIKHHKTLEWNPRESLEMLLEAGADPNIQNHAGETPFHAALKAFKVHPVDIPLVMFVEKGADVNAKVPESGYSFPTLSEYFISEADWRSDYSVVHERRSWEIALHSLLLRTSTTIQGEFLSTALQNLATYCLGRISLTDSPSESLSTLTIELYRRIATDRKVRHSASLPFLPETTIYLKPGHPFWECMSILIACGHYRQLFRRFEVQTRRLDQFLYMILRKNPGPTDCDAVLELFTAGADSFRAPYLPVDQDGPLSICLATRGLSSDSERQKIVRILLRQWTSRDMVLSLSPPTPTTAFWRGFGFKCQTGTWQPPESSRSISRDYGIEASGEDARALWEIMVQLMADKCLPGSDLKTTKMILKDVRRKGIDLKPEWIDQLLDLV